MVCAARVLFKILPQDPTAVHPSVSLASLSSHQSQTGYSPSLLPRLERLDLGPLEFALSLVPAVFVPQAGHIVQSRVLSLQFS